MLREGLGGLCGGAVIWCKLFNGMEIEIFYVRVTDKREGYPSFARMHRADAYAGGSDGLCHGGGGFDHTGRMSLIRRRLGVFFSNVP